MDMEDGGNPSRWQLFRRPLYTAVKTAVEGGVIVDRGGIIKLFLVLGINRKGVNLGTARGSNQVYRLPGVAAIIRAKNTLGGNPVQDTGLGRMHIKAAVLIGTEEIAHVFLKQHPGA